MPSKVIRRRKPKNKTDQAPTRKSFPWAQILGVLLKVGIVVVLAILGYTAYHSSYLKVSRVTITGNKQLRTAEVMKAANVMEENILTLDSQETAKKVEQLPLVKTAKVTRILPHEVLIEIVERSPWGIWQVGDNRYVISTDGVVIDSVSPIDSLPVIKEINGEELAPGEKVDAAAVRLAQRLMTTLPQELGVEVKGFEYKKNGGLVVVMENVWRARFGDDDDFDFKLATWKALLAKAKREKFEVHHVDLRFGYRPFFRW